MHNCYEILECGKSDSLENIKAKYRKLILKYHPDKNSGNVDKFIEVDKAYKYILKQKSLSVSYNDKAKHYMLLMYLFMKPKNIKIDVTVTINDIFFAEMKKINYFRYYNRKKITNSVYIDLLNFKNEYKFEEHGDENPITKKSGDLIVYISIDYKDFKNTLFINDILYVDKIIDKYNISYKIKITLYEYFYGLKNNYPYIVDFLDLSHHVPYKHGMFLTVKNKGLPYELDDESDDEIYRGELTIILDLIVNDVKKETVNDSQFQSFLREYFNT